MSSTTENVKQSLGVCTKCFRTFEDQERSLKKDGIHYNRTCKRCLLYVKNWGGEQNEEEQKEKLEQLHLDKRDDAKLMSKFKCDCGSEVVYRSKGTHFRTIKHQDYIKTIVPDLESRLVENNKAK